MNGHSTQRLTLTCIALTLLIACGLLIWVCGPPHVTVLDDRFKVLSVKVSKGTNHTIFAGGETEGWVRSQLKRLGLGVRTIPEIRSRTPPTHAFLVCYTSTFDQGNSRTVSAELEGQDGSLIPLSLHTTARSQHNKAFVSVWTSPWVVTNTGEYLLRLKEKSTDHSLAEIKVGKLK